MLFSLDWLRTMVDIPEAPEALARRLTMAGLPVDRIEGGGAIPETVVVARVLEARRHPNADRLTLCTVDAGGPAPVQIVCGAPNARAGMLAALALPGTALPNGLTIRKSKIRGETSEGMLCAEDELGLGEDHAGIIELESGTPGEPASTVLAAAPVTLEVDITANRGDCMSHRGLAREIAALTGRPLREPEIALGESGAPAAQAIAVSVEDPEDCPRYLGRVIRGVTIGPSPAWLVARLAAVGQRSINNVVDITNFVLLESGQPLHAFDLDRLGTGRIHVRRAVAGERLTTLDGVARELDPRILLITDGARAVALAGIMGGEESEVKDDTTTILLESAVFRAGRILRGSRHLRLETEAALRFRRGIDPAATAWAVDRAAALIAELGGGTVAPGCVDATAPGTLEPRTVSVRPSRVAALLGEPIGAAEVRERLTAFGFTVSDTGPDAFAVAVPSWRLDVLEEVDLIEEVARHRGYDAITGRDFNASAVNAPVQEEEQRMRRVSAILRGFGFDEALTANLTDARRASAAGLPAEAADARALRVLDPPSREQEALRTTLIPSLLDVAGHNARHGLPDGRYFELAKTFAREAGATFPRETLRVGLVAGGGEFAPSRERTGRSLSFLEFKGFVEALLVGFGVGDVRWREADATAFLPAGALVAEGAGETLGYAWNVTEGVRSRWDLKRPVYVGEVDFAALRPRTATATAYREPSRFPAVRRDLALIVPRETSQIELREWIRGDGGSILETIELFDYYRGRHIPEGHVGLGYSLTFRADDRTLEEAEVDAVVEKLVETLRARGVTRRDT